MTPSIAPQSPAKTPAEQAAQAAASYVRTTDRIAVRTRICRDEIARLCAIDARTMTPADFDQLAQAQAELAQLSER
jgi:multidrug resistance efflux pump